jgi:hypothetical protein
MKEKDDAFLETGNEFYRPTYPFNPMKQSHLKGLPPSELAEYAAKIMGLDHGPGYGTDFFSGAASDLLKHLHERYPGASFNLTKLCGLYQVPDHGPDWLKDDAVDVSKKLMERLQCDSSVEGVEETGETSDDTSCVTEDGRPK